MLLSINARVLPIFREKLIKLDNPLAPTTVLVQIVSAISPVLPRRPAQHPRNTPPALPGHPPRCDGGGAVSSCLVC